MDVAAGADQRLLAAPARVVRSVPRSGPGFIVGSDAVMIARLTTAHRRGRQISPLYRLRGGDAGQHSPLNYAKGSGTKRMQPRQGKSTALRLTRLSRPREENRNINFYFRLQKLPLRYSSWSMSLTQREERAAMAGCETLHA